MPPVQKGGFLGFSSEPTYVMESGVTSGVLQYVYYIFGIILIMMLVLVVVHYTMYPIFRTRAGARGIIPLPGTEDSKLFWKTQKDIGIITENQTPVGSKTENYSFLLDIQLDNPTANTGKPRILFSRGAPIPSFKGQFTDSDTILTIHPSFNVCVYLDKLVNDLYVSVQTVTNDPNLPGIETVILPNIPTRKSIRLGVFVGTRILEVYVNGLLVRSKAFPNSIRSNRGSFQPPLDEILGSTARVQNFRVWGRPVSAAEFRSYGSSIDFDIKEIADSCIA